MNDNINIDFNQIKSAAIYSDLKAHLWALPSANRQQNTQRKTQHIYLDYNTVLPAHTGTKNIALHIANKHY